MMKTLFETSDLRLENEYEATRLVDKRSQEVLMEEEFYGDPTSGLIAADGSWALVGGEHLKVWTQEKGVLPQNFPIRWIHAMRTRDDRQVEILTDPWGEDPAIWAIDMETLALERSRDFPDYRGKPYTEEVLW